MKWGTDPWRMPLGPPKGSFHKDNIENLGASPQLEYWNTGILLGFMNLRKLNIGIVSLIAVFMLPLPVVAKTGKVIEKITVQEKPETVTVKLNGGVSFRVFKIDKKEVVIALKNVSVSKHLTNKAYRKHFVRNIEFRFLPQGIVVLSLYTNRNITAVYPKWSKTKRTLAIRFSLVKSTEKNKPAGDKRTKPPPSATILPKSTWSTLKSLKRKPADSIDGIKAAMIKDSCITHPEISAAMRHCKAGSWQQAYNILDRFLRPEREKDCLEQAYFLRAYSLYKNLDAAAEDQKLKTVDLFQEAVSFFLKSPYAPFGITALGKLHQKMKNYNEAEGYLKYILDSYKDYNGIADIMLELSRVHIGKGNVNLAIATLEKLVARYPNSPFISDAKLELGKALFEANDLQNSLKILTDLTRTDPHKVYESSDLLEYIGKCHYQMGNNPAARKALLRAVNYFPDRLSNDIILTRIADIYHDEKQPEKAQKFYEHVVQNYPGTDGFIISSVRMASYLKRRAEKENLYKLIIDDFPDNPMTQLAYLKLAKLLSESGEHEKSIETIHGFLAKFPGTLKQEVVVVLKEAYGSYFQRLIKSNDMAGLLTMFERDRHIINRIRDPELFLTVGKAYLQEHLYEEATKLLEQSQRLYGKSKSPPELIFSLGVSYQATGQSHKAFKAFELYARSFPKHENIPEAHNRMGQILMARKSYKKAIRKLRVALKGSQQKDVKAEILLELAKANEKLGDYQTATRRLVKAIDLFAAVPETPLEVISKAYRKLGETYLKLNAYLNAADAFSMALKFSEGNQDTDLKFLLGETHEKAKQLERAQEIYQTIVDSGDPFWARLAKERLRGISIHMKLKTKATAIEDELRSM